MKCDVMLTIIAGCSIISLCNTFAVGRKIKKTVGKMKKEFERLNANFEKLQNPYI